MLISVELTPELKADLDKAVLADDAASPIRSITMVGARTDWKHLSKPDAGYLSQIFSICADERIAVASDVSVKVANIEYGGHDFLREPVKSDMVVYSYIYFNKDTVGLHRVQDYVRQSSLAANPDAWHSSLLASEARLAFNVIEGEGRCEVPTSFFARAPFEHTKTIAAPDLNKNLALLRR